MLGMPYVATRPSQTSAVCQVSWIPREEFVIPSDARVAVEEIKMFANCHLWLGQHLLVISVILAGQGKIR